MDPLTPGVYYTTQYDTGVAASTQSLVWASQGLVGPTVTGNNLNIPNAGTVLSANPQPGAPAGTPVTLFRVWEYANTQALCPETSGDNGTTWNSIDSAGINVSNNPAGVNSWKYKTIETLPDGNQNIVYCNVLGEVMLKVFYDINDAGNPSPGLRAPPQVYISWIRSA